MDLSSIDLIGVFVGFPMSWRERELKAVQAEVFLRKVTSQGDLIINS